MKQIIVLILVAIQTMAFSQEINLSTAALELTKQKVTYDGRYFSIPYPNGDIPADKGVCTDVIIPCVPKIRD